jgi:hypothetical protein
MVGRATAPQWLAAGGVGPRQVSSLTPPGRSSLVGWSGRGQPASSAGRRSVTWRGTTPERRSWRRLQDPTARVRPEASNLDTCLRPPALADNHCGAIWRTTIVARDRVRWVQRCNETSPFPRRSSAPRRDCPGRPGRTARFASSHARAASARPTRGARSSAPGPPAPAGPDLTSHRPSGHRLPSFDPIPIGVSEELCSPSAPGVRFRPSVCGWGTERIHSE